MLALRTPKECEPSLLAEWFRNKGFPTIYHLLYGLESKIPLCCVVEWAVRRFLNVNPNLCGGVECRAQYCHCWFHRRTEHVFCVPQLERRWEVDAESPGMF